MGKTNQSRWKLIRCLAIGYLTLGLGHPLFSQVRFQWNAYLDLELSRAGSLSHYYYNEIHRQHTQWRFDLSQLNLLGTLHIGEQWEIGAQVLAERRFGQRAGLFTRWDLYRVVIPQLYLQWSSSSGNVSVALGRFANPFGYFYRNPLFADRNIINSPLAYSYYTNISQRFGYVPGLAEEAEIRNADGNLDWGLPSLYRLGYKTGIRLRVGRPEKTNWTLALVDGAASIDRKLEDPIQLGIFSRLELRPSYFAKIGISLGHGTFLDPPPIDQPLEHRFRYGQSQAGIDFSFGSGFFEWTGEIITSFYQVPLFEPEIGFIEENGSVKIVRLLSYSGYTDLSYEPPFLTGLFLAFRFDFLVFGRFNAPQGLEEQWDNNVYRQVLSIGYKATSFFTTSIDLMTQQVKNRPWNQQQRTFRLMGSFHF